MIKKSQLGDNISINIINGVFLIFLAICGNFLAQTLSCGFQRLLTNSMLAKQVTTFFMIYFTINYSSNVIPSPTDNIKQAFIIYLLFVLFSKTHFKVTSIISLILVIIYISNNYKQYYLVKQKDTGEEKYTKYISFIEQLDTY